MSSQPEKTVLIIDSDPEWSIRISGFLLKADFRTALALNGTQALESIKQLRPYIIVFNIDRQDPSEDEIFEITSAMTPPIPILVTSTVYTFESPELIKAIQKGAFDCLLKPYSSEILLHKIDSANTRRRRIYPELPFYDVVTLFEKINRLHAARTLEALLDAAFEYFMLITLADNALLFLFNNEKQTWRKVREKKEAPDFLEEPAIQKILQHVILSGQPFIDVDRTGTSFNNRLFSDTPPPPRSSIIALPLIAGNELNGVILLQRRSTTIPFVSSDIRAAEIVAAQIGGAFENITLYETVNRKLQELHSISSYSEQLMRMVDKYDVLKSLCEMAVQQVSIDFAGFFIVQRRAHEFVYWSRYTVDEKALQSFCNETITAYNRAAATSLHTRRIAYRILVCNNEIIDSREPPPLAFRYVVPLCWDDLKFGAALFGTIDKPDHIAEKQALLSSIIGHTHIALANTKLYSDMKENYIRTIKALAIAVDSKDTYTHGHSENVMNIAENIARELSIDERTIGYIRDAGLLHDIGKIGIPGYILNKPGPLTHEEFNGIMKTHSTLGANIVRDVPFFRDLHQLILYHHEHYDGRGYPDGLKGEQIPLGARIIHVADAFEAMTSDRPYRMSLGKREAIKRLKNGSGSQFDPSIIAAFLQVASRKKWLTDTCVNQTFPFAR